MAIIVIESLPQTQIFKSLSLGNPMSYTLDISNYEFKNSISLRCRLFTVFRPPYFLQIYPPPPPPSSPSFSPPGTPPGAAPGRLTPMKIRTLYKF